MTDQNIQDEEEKEGYLSLFVGGLNYLSMRDDVKAYFETFGRVRKCILPCDSMGKSRSFAFVSIRNIDNNLDDLIFKRKHEINGKIVDVKPWVKGKKSEDMKESNKKIFVGGLEPTVVDKDLINCFMKFGTIREATVLFDNNKNISRCFGFVTFESEESVKKVLEKVHYLIKGKQVEVKQAQPKGQQTQQKIYYSNPGDIVNKRMMNYGK